MIPFKRTRRTAATSRKKCGHAVPRSSAIVTRHRHTQLHRQTQCTIQAHSGHAAKLRRAGCAAHVRLKQTDNLTDDRIDRIMHHRGAQWPRCERRGTDPTTDWRPRTENEARRTVATPRKKCGREAPHRPVCSRVTSTHVSCAPAAGVPIPTTLPRSAAVPGPLPAPHSPHSACRPPHVACGVRIK